MFYSLCFAIFPDIIIMFEIIIIDIYISMFCIAFQCMEYEYVFFLADKFSKTIHEKNIDMFFYNVCTKTSQQTYLVDAIIMYSGRNGMLF